MAELVQRGPAVGFRYLDGGRLAEARAEGFGGYPGLPMNSPAHHRMAMKVLTRRLPPRSRADFGRMLEDLGLPADGRYSELSLLAYTGARMTSDSFSVCETFDGFEPPFSYVFDVAGYRRHRERTLSLEEGETLRFEREPDNGHDPDAVRIVRGDGGRVGYVNRLQSPVVGKWVDSNEINARVVGIDRGPAHPRLFVRAEFLAAEGTKAA